MRYGDGWSWRESQDGAHRPMGALVQDDCGTAVLLQEGKHAVYPQTDGGRRRDRMALFSKHGGHAAIFFNLLVTAPSG